jgi:hypothetical protein
MPMKVNASIDFSGPYFRKGPAIVKEVTGQFVKRMVELGTDRLHDKLRPEPTGVFKSVQEAGRKRVSRGQYRQGIQSHFSGLQGRIDDLGDQGKIYGPWLEGTSTRNQTTKFKGYFQFRKTRDWMQEQVKPEAKKFIRLFARKLNGK